MTEPDLNKLTRLERIVLFMNREGVHGKVIAFRLKRSESGISRILKRLRKKGFKVWRSVNYYKPLPENDEVIRWVKADKGG